MTVFFLNFCSRLSRSVGLCKFSVDALCVQKAAQASRRQRGWRVDGSANQVQRLYVNRVGVVKVASARVCHASLLQHAVGLVNADDAVRNARLARKALSRPRAHTTTEAANLKTKSRVKLSQRRGVFLDPHLTVAITLTLT